MTQGERMHGETGTFARELERLALDPAVRAAAVAERVDAWPVGVRAEAVRGLSRRAQGLLYEKVRGFASVRLAELVPADRGELETVRHLGRNTLPAFTHFEKRFCRLPGTSRNEPGGLAGWNFHPLSGLIGPGYFLAIEDASQGEVLIDYRRLPSVRPADWPAIRSNSSGAARFVYGFMVDTLRRVARDVTIGSAARHGRDLGSHFVLAREGA